MSPASGEDAGRRLDGYRQAMDLGPGATASEQVNLARAGLRARWVRPGPRQCATLGADLTANELP